MKTIINISLLLIIVTLITSCKTTKQIAKKKSATNPVFPTHTTKTEGNKVMVFEKGMASMIEIGQNSQKYQALHRTAPTGSFMRIINLNNGKIVVVSVIGKLPKNTPKNEIIQLTKRAYDQIEASGKILVEIDYDLEKD